MNGPIVLLAIASVAPVEDASQRIHQQQRHPDEIVIAPGPRWTTTYAPLHSGRPGESDDAVPVPQEGGGHDSDEVDGWDGDRWIDPNTATPLGGEPTADEVPVEEAEAAGAHHLILGGGGDSGEGVLVEQEVVAGGAGGVGGPPSHVEREAAPPEPEPEPVPEPEPEPEPEPPEPVAEPEPEVAPPEPVPEHAGPSAQPPPPAPPALDDPGPIAPSWPIDPTSTAPAQPAPAPVDHRPFWLALVSLVAVGALVRAYVRWRRARPKVVRPVQKVAVSVPIAPASPMEITQTEFDYAGEIRAMLRAGLVAVGWQPYGRDLARTAREVSRSLPGADPRRAELGQLVRIGEAIRFAGIEATTDDYQRARHCLQAIHSVPRPPVRTQPRPGATTLESRDDGGTP